MRKENTSWLNSIWVFVLTIGLIFITGLTEAEESRNEDLDFKEKNYERVKNKKNIKKRNK